MQNYSVKILAKHFHFIIKAVIKKIHHKGVREEFAHLIRSEVDAQVGNFLSFRQTARTLVFNVLNEFLEEWWCISIIASWTSSKRKRKEIRIGYYTGSPSLYTYPVLVSECCFVACTVTAVASHWRGAHHVATGGILSYR